MLSSLWRGGSEAPVLNRSNYHRRTLRMRFGTIVCQTRPSSVRLRNMHQAWLPWSDKGCMRTEWAERAMSKIPAVPWALEMKAVSQEEPARLVKTLTGGILGCGGWVLSRGATDTGVVNLLFEFERRACLDIYSVLIATGLELNQAGHIRFTELCQCTRSRQEECAREIASVDLEIRTFPPAFGPGGAARSHA